MAAIAARRAFEPLHRLGEHRFAVGEYVENVLSVMSTCGMYDYAGEWAYEVGMPAKSGVSGCIIAVIPGQIGICVYSPPIDQQGNSLRGIRVCQEISKEFELHAFNNRTNVRSVIRRVYRGDRVRSSRLRTAQERELLDVARAALDRATPASETAAARILPVWFIFSRSFLPGVGADARNSGRARDRAAPPDASREHQEKPSGLTLMSAAFSGATLNSCSQPRPS